MMRRTLLSARFPYTTLFRSVLVDLKRGQIQWQITKVPIRTAESKTDERRHEGKRTTEVEAPLVAKSRAEEGMVCRWAQKQEASFSASHQGKECRNGPHPSHLMDRSSTPDQGHHQKPSNRATPKPGGVGASEVIARKRNGTRSQERGPRLEEKEETAHGQGAQETSAPSQIETR